LVEDINVFNHSIVKEDYIRLKIYVRKRFGSKENFLSFLQEKMGVVFPKNISYRDLLSKLDETFQREKWLSILGVESLEDAEVRAYLFDALCEGLPEWPVGEYFIPLYEKLVGEKIKIRSKREKREPARRLAFEVNRRDFIRVWVQLCRKEKLPFVVHYKNVTLGALGWLRSVVIRKKSFVGGYVPEIMDVIERFDEDSQLKILSELVVKLKEISEDPERFGFSEKIGREIIDLIEIINEERDGFVKMLMGLQLIFTYLNDEDFIGIINDLLARNEIKPPKINGFYEEVPLDSDIIVTRYGIIKRVFEKSPNELLAELLQKELKQEDLEPDLEGYHGEFSLRVLEYCIKEDPREILSKMFGIPRLRNIVEKYLALKAARKIKSTDELVDLILLGLGFDLPPKTVEGINSFRGSLVDSEKRVKSGEDVRTVMMDVFDGLDKILRELSYFYLYFLWDLENLEETEERIEKIDKLVWELKVANKQFSKLTLGERVKLLRALNNKIKKDKNRKKKFYEAFNREYVLSSVHLNILDRMVKYRNKIVHKEEGVIFTKKDALEVIEELKKLTDTFKREEIYPKVVRVKREVTNEYGISYFEAEDEDGIPWTIGRSHWIDTTKLYFMRSKTSPVAIDPLLIEKAI